MDYEKKYKKALERARQFSKKPYLEDSAGIVEYIFPELAESEDDRIKEEIISFVEQAINAGYGIIDKERKDKWITWLEKYGEQKSVEWSEEDEKQARQIERIVHVDGCTQKLQKQIADWLKSIKDRVKSKHKNKFLKPQNAWRPSNEQMDALKEACDKHWEPDGFDPLYTLWEQLKELMEE